MLEFFNKVSDTDSKSQRQQHLMELKERVVTFFKNHYERGFSFYFDIQSWIESKLTGKDFAEVVRNANLGSGIVKNYSYHAKPGKTK